MAAFDWRRHRVRHRTTATAASTSTAATATCPGSAMIQYADVVIPDTHPATSAEEVIQNVLIDECTEFQKPTGARHPGLFVQILRQR